MSNRRRFGGMNTSPVATHGTQYRPHDYLFPSGSILGEPASSPLKFSEPLQTILDCLAVVAGALLVTLTAVSAVVAFAILLFVKM
jgi:hypothetical protein